MVIKASGYSLFSPIKVVAILDGFLCVSKVSISCWSTKGKSVAITNQALFGFFIKAEQIAPTGPKPMYLSKINYPYLDIPEFPGMCSSLRIGLE